MAIAPNDVNVLSVETADLDVREGQNFDVTIENVRKFHEWREYLYLNVLGFPPEPVFIRAWPEEIPQPKAA